MTTSGTAAPRIIGLVEGDPHVAISGIGHFLLQALGRRLPLVGTIDFAPRGATRLALAAATFDPRRDRWRARFHTGLLAHRVLSATLARRLRASELDYDLALQVFGWASGQPSPYALYVDQTRMMAERGWPGWMPLTPAERSEVLAREQAMYRGARHILVMGEDARASLIADYAVPRDAVTVVGGGLMFDRMPEAAGPASEPTITFVGRDFERKGGTVLLDAFASVRARLPAARLQIVGTSRRLHQPGITVCGKVRSRARMAELYRATRVFCMPSLYEPWGLAYVEAMAHGVPCVGTTTQSIPEILDQGRAGLLVPPGSTEALADALIRLCTDSELAVALGQAGRRHVARALTWDHVAERAAPALLGAVGR